MAKPRLPEDLRLAEVEPPGLERLDDLFDRLATEVRDCRQLRLRLLQQLPDRLDAGALEAVVGADAQLELLDEDVVHRSAATAADPTGHSADTGQPAATGGAVAGTGL